MTSWPGESDDRPSDGADATSVSRRNVLNGIAGTGFTMWGYADAVAATEAAPGRSLGDFEDGFDGWKTSGGNRLRRVRSAGAPAPVTEGTFALAVDVDGDPVPSIRYTKRVRGVDFARRPYLLADVLPGPVERTDSPVTFKFRYAHRGRGRPVESPEIVVMQRSVPASPGT